MRKQFTFITILILICGSMSFGQQTGSLTTVIASPGESVSIPMTVGGGWNSISAISMYISFTKNVLTFSGVSGVVPALNGYLADVDTATSTVHFVWDKTTTANLSGINFYLNYVYNGATSSPLHFLPTCDIETGLLPPTRIYPTWTDGAVNPKTNNAQTATIGGILTASTGSPVTVPLMFGGFGAYGSNVGSITQKIHYDVTKLSFAGITTSGNLSGAMAYASNGLITITWTSTTGKNIDFPANQLNLIFGYNGITATTL